MKITKRMATALLKVNGYGRLLSLALFQRETSLASPNATTTNAIERLHKEFRRALKIRDAMPSVDSVLLLLSAISCEMEKTAYKHLIYNFSYEPNFQRKKYI